MNLRTSIVLFFTALAPALLIDPRAVRDYLFPIDESALMADFVDVGRVRPQEHVSGEIILHNKSRRTILLGEIRSDCSCMIVGKAPDQIGAGEDAKIAFELRAPTGAGPFVRQIAIASRDVDVAWTCSVQGQVNVDIWSDSPILELPWNDDRDGEVTFAVYHRDGVSVKQIVSSDSTITIAEQWPITGGQMVRAVVGTPSEGKHPPRAAEVRVYTDSMGPQPQLTIPIRIKSRPAFVCVPATLSLQDFEQQPNDIAQETVAVLLRSNLKAEHVRVSSLVSWARVDIKQVSTSVLSLTATVARTAMPANFEGPLIRLTAEGHNYSYDLSAIRADSIERLSHIAQ